MVFGSSALYRARARARSLLLDATEPAAARFVSSFYCCSISRFSPCRFPVYPTPWQVRRHCRIQDTGRNKKDFLLLVSCTLYPASMGAETDTSGPGSIPRRARPGPVDFCRGARSARDIRCVGTLVAGPARRTLAVPVAGVRFCQAQARENPAREHPRRTPADGRHKATCRPRSRPYAAHRQQFTPQLLRIHGPARFFPPASTPWQKAQALCLDVEIPGWLRQAYNVSAALRI
jgi:hypothetical protein